MLTAPHAPVLAVTLNPALDLTYRVTALRPGQEHRPRAVGARAGGKGVNVARVLHTLGLPVLALAPVGGTHTHDWQSDLAAAGVPAETVPIAGQTRRTVAVVEDDGRTTGLWEPGPRLTPDEWQRLTNRVRRLAAHSCVVVLSGSLPGGLPPSACADLVRHCHEAGAPVVLDTSGPALRAALAAGPDLVKPNTAELAEYRGAKTGGHGPRDGHRTDPDEAAAHDAALLLDAGAAAVAASRGADGLTAVAEGRAWHAAPPSVLRGNPTGAGDAAVAALAVTLATGAAWPERLRHAVALSAAAVAAPLAGDVDPALYADLLTRTTVRDGGPFPPRTPGAARA
ncbi:1-phosphofructokinase family hexose kinase [Kitasatospora indigofera]|uniref:1-phosphofructokinase family hexose kinase n=1 Tax=Kitasatospora indigofera TaxID=67307 RepID=UPI00365CAE74